VSLSLFVPSTPQPVSPPRLWNERTVLLFLIALLAVMTLAPLARTLFTATDDAYNFVGIAEGWRSPWIYDAQRSGRLQHVFDGQLMAISYGWGILWLAKTLSLLSILANVATLFVMVRTIAANTRFAALAAVFFFAFAQYTWDHNLFTAYPFTFHLGLTAFFISVTCWWKALAPDADARAARRFAIASAACYAVSLFVYENFLAYFPVFPVMTMAATDLPWRGRLWRSIRGPHLPLVVVFVVLLVLFRVLFYTAEGEQFNAGEQYELSLAPAAVLKVIERYGVAALPMHYFRIYRDLVKDFYLGYGTPRPRLLDIFLLFDMAWFVRAAIVAFLVTALTAVRTQVRQRLVLLVLALVLAVASNLPLAVTLKYQTWVTEFYSRGYITAYFVFFGIVILLGLGVDGLVGLFAVRGPALRRFAVGVFAVVSFVVSYGTDFVNAHVVRTQRLMYDREAAIDAWVASPSFKALPAGSVVFAPSLWDKLYEAQTQLWDENLTNYWEHHVMAVGRRFTARNAKGDWAPTPEIRIVRKWSTFQALAQAPGMAGKIYYLKAMQERRSDDTYLVFAEITHGEEGEPLRAREVRLLAHAKSDRLTVLGRLFGADAQCRARVLVDGARSSGTFASDFVAHIDRTRRSEPWLWSRIQGVGGLIDPESLVVTGGKQPIAEDVTVDFASGFYDDEFVHRWAEQQATFALRNRSERPITVDFFVELHIPSAQPTQTFPVDVTAAKSTVRWNVGADFQKHTIRVAIPPLASTPVVFKTEAPSLPNQGRNLVMMFAMPVRTEEVSCAVPPASDDARAR